MNLAFHEAQDSCVHSASWKTHSCMKFHNTTIDIIEKEMVQGFFAQSSITCWKTFAGIVTHCKTWGWS